MNCCKKIPNLTVWLLWFLLLQGCSNPGGKPILTDLQIPACDRPACIRVLINNPFFLVKQIHVNSCWASALAMMYSWKKGEPVSEEEILKPLPYYLNLYRNSDKTGLTFTEEIMLYQKLGIETERQLNPSIKGWVEMIQNYGPLSITIDARPPFGTIHAILLLAIYGNENGLNTKVVYADPADGQLHTVDFLGFLKMYESKYAVDWPLQIIHFK